LHGVADARHFDQRPFAWLCADSRCLAAKFQPTVEQTVEISPDGLKPVEQEAWLAMARRNGASELASFYPAHYGEPFVVENAGVRVAVRPLGGSDVGAQVDNGQVIYREAYPETNSVHVVGGGRSEEFLYLQSDCAPREFAYEISEMSAGMHVELVGGEVRFTNKAGQGVKIEAPWLVETNGVRRTDVVHWELDPAQKGAGPQRLRLVVADGLRYPLVIDPSWTLTGSLNTGREFHTATLLSNGQVLVAGGNDSTFAPLSSAELYDPTNGTWTPTGSLNYPHDRHTATLLLNGQVLVAGGSSTSQAGESSAELYNPTSGTWTLTGSLNGGQGRHAHAAILLPSGKVLVAGGFDEQGEALSSAELYDPGSGMWTPTGSLHEAHTLGLTATLLHSGKVLLAGGAQGNNVPLSSAELYDPATGLWTATGSLGDAREGHTATLLPSGKVLVAGGTEPLGTDCELYDPASGTWGPTDSLNDARAIHTATLLPSNTVLAAGGDNGNLSSAELYAAPCGGITFTNPTSVTINDSGTHPVPASPYPSNIVVAGMPGSISKVTVKLNNITHARPGDIDILLIGPQGQTAVIMSDTGGTPTVSGGITNVTLTLDDVAISTSSVPGTVANVNYNGLSTAPTNAATYAVTADFVPSDTTNYNTLPALSAGNFTIQKATPTATLAVSNSPQTYNGSPQSASVVVSTSSAPGAAANVKYNGSSSAPTNAATYAVTADFVPTDTTNYNTVPGLSAGNFSISKATPTATLSVSNSPAIYNGSPQSATVVVSTSSVPGSVLNIGYNGSSSAPTNAATYAITADFVPGDTNNYNTLPALPAGNFVIQQAIPTITWSNPADITYGTALGATQLNANANVAGSFVYSPAAGTVLNAGNGQSLSTTFTPTDTANYNPATASVNINVQKATPTVNWSNPADIVYGTALSGTQLDAMFNWVVNGLSVTVDGTATYTPPSGTVLPAGADQDLNVVFTPTDTTNYNNASKDVTINVTSPTPTPTATPTATPTPSYAAQIQQPINADQSSVFNVKRGVVPVQFTLTLNGAPTCALPQATIAVTRIAGGVIGSIGEDVYNGPADTGSNFRISNCQYIYNLSANALGVGTYRVDILIDNQVVGSAIFGLK
jgi:hypothetical protein